MLLLFKLSLENFLIVSAIIFSIGLYGALSKRNAITVLMSIELMFNAINIAAVAFSRYVVPAKSTMWMIGDDIENSVQFVLTGQIFSMFIITVAAAEVALGLAIIIAIYRNIRTVSVTNMSELKK